MPLSTPIKDLVDDDEATEVIEVPTKQSKKCKNSNYFGLGNWVNITHFHDAIMIVIASFIILNVSLDRYAYASKGVEYIGEIPLQSLLIAIAFVLMKIAVAACY